MVVRRNDTRRRRVVVEPAMHTGDIDVPVTKPAKSKAKRETRPYSFGADRRNQLKTTDLLPKRVLSCSLVVLMLAASIALLNLLAFHAPTWAARLGDDGVSSLSLTGRGTLACWFSSFLLIISGLASLQIYALRQHRRDDYGGTYRLWLWMSALLLFASLNCVVDLTVIATNLLQSFTAVTIEGRPWLPVAVKLVFLTTLVARGLYEVRASRGTFALVVFVWVAYSVAAVLQLPAVRPELVQLPHETLLGNSLLFATAALFLAELSYARYIYLQAHGLIRERAVKQRTNVKSGRKQKSTPTKKRKASAGKESTSASAGKSTATTRRKKPTTSAKPSRKTAAKSNSDKVKSTTTKSPRSKPVAKSEEAETEGVIKLSKSERRRRRKEERRRKAA